MTDLVVEVGIKLKKDLAYYENILKKAGAINTYNCETIDLYYTDKNLDGMSEKQMKDACVRYRMSRGLSGEDFNGDENWKCYFQNYQIFDHNHCDEFPLDHSHLGEYEEKFSESKFGKIFATSKMDYQYHIGDMKSRIQLQDIKDVGLLLYYDNPDYYGQELEEQRKNLIAELRLYGFEEIDDNTLGLDKLRTLYYKKECYSKNQNA